MIGKWMIRLAASVLLVAGFILILSRSLNAYLSHDEHQFIVPGLLTVDGGLTPYRDYPLFHTPYLVMLNGVVASGFEHKLLAARLLTALAIGLTLWLLGAMVWRMFGDRSSWSRLLIAAAFVGLFVFAPVVAETSDYIWNHGVPVALVLLSFSIHLAVAGRRLPLAWLVAGGVALGLAAGMRLTFLPLFAPFGIATLFIEGDWRRRINAALWFSAGCIVAMLPIGWLLVQYPEQVIFDNLKYPRLSLAWRKYPWWAENIRKFVDPQLGFLPENSNAFRGRSIARKLEEFSKQTLVEHIPLFVAFVLIGLPLTLWGVIRSRGRDFMPMFLLLTIPFVWWGCMAPSRFNPQYYYALIPFLLLSTAYGVSILQRGRWPALAATSLFVLCVLVAVFQNHSLYASLAKFREPERMGTVSFHNVARLLRSQVNSGKVLTLEPMIALEAGLDIYPEFAMGEFTWRSAHLVAEDKRKRLKFVCPYDLEERLSNDPPAAVFLDKHDEKLNSPLRKFAVVHGMYRAMDEGGYEVWIPKG